MRMDRVTNPRDSTHSCNSRSEQLYGILTKNNLDILNIASYAADISAAGVEELCGFSLLRRLFANLPMLEGVNVATLRTLPCPFLRISIALMYHLDNQMAVQAHRWPAVD